MALLSGVHVLGVSLLNSLPYYILENNARAHGPYDIKRFILKCSMAVCSGERVLWVSLLKSVPYYILENNASCFSKLFRDCPAVQRSAKGRFHLAYADMPTIVLGEVFKNDQPIWAANDHARPTCQPPMLQAGSQ